MAVDKRAYDAQLAQTKKRALHVDESGEKSPPLSADMINHPPHYISTSGLESIDVIEAFALNFCLGNAVKYILRASKKGSKLEDLQKARWYISREIESTRI